MRFSLRFIIGLCLFLAGLAAAGWGVSTLTGTIAERRAEKPRASAAKEREYAVSVGVIRNGRERPQITAYGEIRSWRTLELRATTGGFIVELAESFRDGAEVTAGDLLFRIDPEDYAAAEADARAAVSEAEVDLREAVRGLEVADLEFEAAETQRELRARALGRQQDLLARGVSTSSAVEEAEMALASASQTAASRAQMRLSSEIKIDRLQLRLERAQIALLDARRTLADTEHSAPFTGLLTEVTAVLGALATPNERLGLLIDPTALEAAFRVTNAQFARLLGEDGALRPIDVAVTLDLDSAPLTVQGVIDRAGATIEAGETGRVVFAKLDLPTATILRPGDFVSVVVTEPALENVARIPASATTETGEILIVEDERLRTASTTILRRIGDDVIVRGAPEGAVYVSDRGPQLGPGVKVRILGDDPTAAPEPGDSAPAPQAAAGGGLVNITPEQQKQMIAFVEQSQRMPAEMKTRVLSLLRAGKAPQRLIDRIRERRGG